MNISFMILFDTSMLETEIKGNAKLTSFVVDKFLHVHGPGAVEMAGPEEYNLKKEDLQKAQIVEV